jgi:homospermidine synthase
MRILKADDILIDLSTNIDCIVIWSMCMMHKVMYLNLAMEEWPDSHNPNSFPKSIEELYRNSLGFRHNKAKNHKLWNSEKGTTSVFEHAFNPGLISHIVKKGIIDASSTF